MAATSPFEFDPRVNALKALPDAGLWVAERLDEERSLARVNAIKEAFAGRRDALRQIVPNTTWHALPAARRPFGKGCVHTSPGRDHILAVWIRKNGLAVSDAFLLHLARHGPSRASCGVRREIGAPDTINLRDIARKLWLWGHVERAEYFGPDGWPGRTIPRYQYRLTPKGRRRLALMLAQVSADPRPVTEERASTKRLRSRLRYALLFDCEQPLSAFKASEKSRLQSRLSRLRKRRGKSGRGKSFK